MSGAATPADLRRVDLFDDLDDAGLEVWSAATVSRDARAGDPVAAFNEPVEGVLLLLDGALTMTFVYPDREEPAGRQVAPTWSNAILSLTGGPLSIRIDAETDCRIALIPRPDFERLALAYPPVHRRVMAQVAPVIGRFQSIENTRGRLAALGRMAAGLAHELNNPAAAARRAAAQMADALEVLSSTIGHFVELGVERSVAAELVALQQEAIADAKACTVLDALDAADAEDDLRDHLEDIGVEEAWRLSEPLALARVDTGWIDRVAELAGPATNAALGWVAASLTARSLAVELQESTARMSGLVTAVKTYTYMDRGSLVDVDLHEGLETTLTVLGHKLKHTSIDVVRDYDRAIPHITARGSELNQVWTNLIDNAVDALGDTGTLTIATRRDGDCAVVEIADDGPGIPPETLPKIFEDFFTTKDVGQGTGLGLATARRIVVDRHGGDLAVDSHPGRTVFRARLPLQPVK